MSILTLFIIIPTLTVIGILFSKSHIQVKWVAVVGMSLQLLSAVTTMMIADNSLNTVSRLSSFIACSICGSSQVDSRLLLRGRTAHELQTE